MSTPSPGRWPVVLSGRAIRELRLLSQDKRTLEIVRTKLKELSCGQFTTDNYLAVRGSSEYIPIYRARLSNDLRIIYIVDIVSDSQNKFDRQVVKVFSVSSRARVAYDFWVKVSRLLAQQGTEYRNRCIQRDVLSTPNGPINVSASFDHKEYIPVVADPESIVDAGSDMNELHETVVLERFTPVTESLYKAILADMEAVLPMALNPDEKAIVRHQGTSVVVGRSGTGKTTALIYKMRANAQLGARSEGAQPMRQLFVTRSRVLTQHVAANYRGLIESSEIASKSAKELEEMRKANQQYQNRELVEFDNEVDLRDDLPRRFSQLTQAHFPLFISFEKLCDLLEADTFPSGDTLVSTTRRTPRLITFGDFKHRYWPTFDYKLTRRMDPALVYSEILGVIKGSGRNLSKNEYMSNLSHKKSPLLVDVRDQVYGIFEAYTKQSRLRGEIDAADRTRALLENHKITRDSQVDYIFVDEVQDHLMADVRLLQSLCSNLDGSYWCGDTAQTINIGSSFRIKELKAYIYENMLPQLGDASDWQRKAIAPFSTFELTVNFRSHGGIVRYAASLVELIYTLFPNSIDHMKPESAKTPGNAPLLFVSPVDDEAMFIRYLLNNKYADRAIFGAQQAIIVRSDSTAKSLTTRLQKRCTVLSLLETKGLEFDDLILYNFFAESEAPASAWRVILGLTVHNESGRIQYNKPDPSVLISPVLCSELKQLYVAVTRARHRCWLWDSGTTIDLMKVFWERSQLIDVSKSLGNLGRFPAPSKDLRQWAHRGQEFFSKGLYALAVTCFELTGQVKEAAIADAYQHMSEAKFLLEDNQESRNAFIKAAEKMKTCAQSGEGNNSSHSSATLWYHAATCFEAASEASRASQSYFRGGHFNQAALVSFEAQDMDECLRVLVSYGANIETRLMSRIKDFYSVHYFGERKYSQLRRLFGGNLTKCIDCARALGFEPQFKELLEMYQRFKERADAHLENGLPAEAVHCLLQNLCDNYSFERSRKIVSTFLWSNFTLDATPDAKSTEQAAELIDICTSALGGFADESARHDIDLFRMISSQANVSLDILQAMLSKLDHANEEDEARIILIQHHVLKSNDWISSDSHHTFSLHLQMWREYVASIKSLEALQDPSQHKAIRRLLGLSDSTTSATHPVHIPVWSTLYVSSLDNRSGRLGSGKKSQRDGTCVTPSVANQRIRNFLAEHLNKTLPNIHSALLGSPWTRNGLLYRGSTSLVPTGPNSGATDAPSLSFEELIRHLSSIFLVFDQIKGGKAGEGSRLDVNKVQILWLTRLFNVIFPATGSIRNINSSLSKLENPEVLCSWVSEALEILDPVKHTDRFATLLMMYFALASELYPGRAPAKVIPRVKLKNGARLSPKCPRHPDQFTKDLSVLFQRSSHEELYKVVDLFELILKDGLAVDIAVLVHLVERVVREATWSMRASVSTSDSGPEFFLIAPSSWAMNLEVHAKLVRPLTPSSFNKLMSCIKKILGRILDGLPAHWKPVNNELWTHTSGSLVARLIWLACFVAVNSHPEHPSLPAALDAMKPVMDKAHPRSSLVSDLERMRINWEIFSQITDQQSCLSVLSQTFQHEELVMLSYGNDLVCPEKPQFVHKVIAFKSLPNLQALFLPPERPMPDAEAPLEAQTGTVDLKVLQPEKPPTTPGTSASRPAMAPNKVILRRQESQRRRLQNPKPLLQRQPPSQLFHLDEEGQHSEYGGRFVNLFL